MPSPAVNLLLRRQKFALPAGNLITQPNYVSGWTAFNATKTNNAILSPNGDWTAAQLAEDGTTNSHGVINGGAAGGGAAGTYQYSFFLWAGPSLLTDRIWWAEVFDTPSYAGYARALFDPRTGAMTVPAVQAPFSAITAWTVPFPNQWWRCFLRFTTSGSTGFDPESFFWSVAAGGTSFAGNTACAVGLWQADLRLV